MKFTMPSGVGPWLVDRFEICKKFDNIALLPCSCDAEHDLIVDDVRNLVDLHVDLASCTCRYLAAPTIRITGGISRPVDAMVRIPTLSAAFLPSRSPGAAPRQRLSNTLPASRSQDFHRTLSEGNETLSSDSVQPFAFTLFSSLRISVLP